MSRKRAPGPSVERGKDGALVLRRLPPAPTLALLELPRLLAPGGAGLPPRLEGCPYEGDDEAGEQWKRHAVPELRHLFEGARDTVLRDLAGIEPEKENPLRFRLSLPASHLPAWISTLGGVRVALGERNGVTEDDMESDLPALPSTEKDRALLRIYLLGTVQGMLLEAGD